MKLMRNGRSVENLFELLGQNENDMTAGLAYVLAASPALVKQLIRQFEPDSADVKSNAIVHIQTARRNQGITDVEIHFGDELFVILEAKRGPALPADSQLLCYADVAKAQPAKRKLLVTVSNASNDLARLRYPAGRIDEIPLVHLSWREIRGLVELAKVTGTYRTKDVLHQYHSYLGKLLGMETRQSNMVYVVSLSHGRHEEWGLNWIDVVEKYNKYYFPVGGGWPDPPNYLGFRYDGRLQYIRHVRESKVFTNPRQVFPEATDIDIGPYHCLDLDAPIIPAKATPTGPRIHRANRCWRMIDTLLTCKSISDALTETERRLS